ncbi:MAG: hypothetical protein IKA78_00300 [Oscillospiraceae bacterium]|nr:hypothetical protein [Oscillospiraceae bacterium]
MDRQDLILNILFTIVLILGWIAILFVSFLIYLLSDMVRNFGGGVLVYIAGLLYVSAFVLPILFRKRLSKHFPLPVSLIIFSILSVVAVVCMLGGAKRYISDFSREKWSAHERLRKYMIDDLEREHGIVGKTDTEIVALLGEPIYIENEPQHTYEYYVGESIIDPCGYQIRFEDHIAVSTKLFEH